MSESESMGKNPHDNNKEVTEIYKPFDLLPNPQKIMNMCRLVKDKPFSLWNFCVIMRVSERKARDLVTLYKEYNVCYYWGSQFPITYKFTEEFKKYCGVIENEN